MQVTYHMVYYNLQSFLSFSLPFHFSSIRCVFYKSLLPDCLGMSDGCVLKQHSCFLFSFILKSLGQPTTEKSILTIIPLSDFKIHN